VGVLAASVEDAALGLGVLAGADYPAVPGKAPRLAVAPELVGRAEAGTAAQVRAAVEAFARAGADVAEVKLPPSFAGIHAAGQTVLEAEAAAYHEPAYRKHPEEFREGIRALIRTGLEQSAVAYVGANRARLRFRDEVAPVLAAYDAVIGPTAPAPAPAGLAWTGDASLCAPWSSAGLPAVTLPCGVSAAGLPEAVQLVATAGDEARLLRAAAWCARVLAFARQPAL
jgi:Asp-tRNA(Asn)/Glu-tRNA(Gln) amidotransferase A subunit family amidase